MNYRYCRKLIVVGFASFLVSPIVNAYNASYIFAPAPANLSGNLNTDKMGLDVSTVQINGAANVSATTFRYLSKRGRNHRSGHKKSLESVNYYITSMSSRNFDSGFAFGFGFDGIGGSASGSAFIFGTGMDLQTVTRSTTNSSSNVLSLNMHMDVGLQHHLRLKSGITMVPWSKLSYVYSDATTYSETQVDDGFGGSKTYHDSSDANASFAALSYGMDFLLRGYSIGAMYQQGENAAVTKISVTADF